MCNCGVADPNYIPPHEHIFTNGKCECGDENTNYVKNNKEIEKAVILINSLLSEYFTNIDDSFIFENISSGYLKNIIPTPSRNVSSYPQLHLKIAM